MALPALRELEAPVDLDLQLRLYRSMLLIRRFEERVLELFSQGLLHGTTHACIGQEAISAALFEHVGPDDLVFSNHRCHGHYLMHQRDPEGILAELMGRQAGTCGGWGGSQHLHRGNFYSNGVLGGTVAATLGLALSLRFGQDTRDVAVVFLGDGALGEGICYESFNLAALWKLPVLFVVENNYYSQSTPSTLEMAGSIAGRFEAFSIPVTEVTTNDAVLLHSLAGSVVEHVRTRKGPAALVINTFRLCSHSRSDDGRPEEVIAPWRAHDPLLLAEKRLDAGSVESVRQEIAERLAEVEKYALASPPPESQLLTDLPQPEAWASENVESKLGPALNRAFHRILAHDHRVVLLGEDILDPYGGAFKVSKGLSTAFPDRVLTTPISEAAMTGLAGGLALRGMKPVVEIMFGDFSTLVTDSLINYITKYRRMYNDQARCGVVIRTPMGARRGYGPTHSQSLERLFLGLPDLRVVALSLLHDPEELLGTAVVNDSAAVLLVENKSNYAQKLLRPDAQGWLQNFRWRQTEGSYPSITLSPIDFRPAQCTLVTYGGMVELAMEASRQLLVEHEHACEIVVLSCISPIEWTPIRESLARCQGRLVTAEEGQLFAAWGAETVAHCAGEGWLRSRPGRVGAPGGVIPSARELENEFLPQIDDIVEAVLKCCDSR